MFDSFDVHSRRPMCRLLGTLVVSFVLVTAACSDDRPDTGSDSLPPTTASTPATSRPDGSAPAPEPTTTDAPRGQVEMRDFTVDEARVRVLTALDELPEHATEIEASATVIADGDRTILCLSGVDESLPPQCSGPIVDGLVVGDWAQTAGGVSFGERTVHVTWPPVDGQVTLIDEREYAPPPGPDVPAFGTPVECRDINTPIGIDTLGQYADAHPDTTAISYLADGVIGVLQVSGDLEQVRADLADDGAEPCLVQVAYSSNELTEARDAIEELRDELWIIWTTAGGLDNRVTVGLAVGDATTVRRMAEAVVDPAMLDVRAVSTILAGE